MTLYHGTRRPFKRGGLLLPRAEHGGAGTSAPVTVYDHSDRAARFAYATEDRAIAWVYAWHAPGRGRPRVLVVDPLGAVERDPEHSLDMRAWRFEAALVREVFLIPEVSEQDAREGWVLS